MAGAPAVRFSIRNKLLAAFLLVLFPLFIYTVYDYRQHEAERRGLILEKHELAARLLGEHIDTYLHHVRNIAALSGAEAAEYTSDPLQLRETLRRGLGPDAPFSSLAYFSEKGAPLSAYPKLHPRLAGPELRASVEGRPFAVSNLFRGGDGASVGLWVRVQSREGSRGIVAATLPATKLALGMQMRVGRSGAIEVSDATGRAVFTSHDFPLTWGERDRSSLPTIRNALRGEPSKTMGFTDPITGKTSLGVSVPISNGWTASIFQPREEAMSPLSEDRFRAIAVWALFSGLALLLAWLAGLTISAPIRRLAKAATAIGRGAYSTRVDASSGDELGILAANLNAMAQRIDERFAHQRFAAETLQRTFLPNLEVLEVPLEIGAAHASATEEYLVGGDFYDIFHLPDNRIALMVGDISGKGIGAASLSVEVRSILKAFSLEGFRPADALSRLNEVLFILLEPEFFVTVFFGILDPLTWRIRYANAGHPGPLLNGPGRYPQYLGATGPAAGALPHCSYEEEEATLDPGVIFILYTDGVIEARHETELFGERRLEKAARKHSNRGAQDLADGIYRACVGFTGGRLSDDLTLLVLRRPPGSTAYTPPTEADRKSGLRRTG